MEYKKWLSYWKKCLSDSLKSDIDLEKTNHFEIGDFDINSLHIKQIEKVNKLIDFEESRLNRKKGIISKDSANWSSLDRVQVLIAPLKLVPIPENLVYFKDKVSKSPFMYYVIVDRKGNLLVPEETFPVFQRKYLEPLADERTEFIFSSVEKVDEAMALGMEKYGNFYEYINYVKSVFIKAINQTVSSYEVDGYHTVNNGIVLLPDEDINAAIGIIHLYEKILKSESVSPLLVSFIDLDNKISAKPLEVADLLNANELHLGQMSFEFPLSISQRKGLYTLLKDDSKVFAVNGPPGTGKTTLLQSVVANKIVESALKGQEPALILACSTNNQAVTNIIDSFSKSITRDGKLQGRWLPEIDGYATYLPANSKDKSELKGINYKKQNGEGLFNKIENNSYVLKAKTHFIQKASEFIGEGVYNIHDINNKLQKEIIHGKSILVNASLKWKAYLSCHNKFLKLYIDSNSVLNRYYEEGIIDEKIFKEDIVNLSRVESGVLQYFNDEPLFRKVFCFFKLKAALASRASEVKIILRDILVDQPIDFLIDKVEILRYIGKKIQLANEIVKIVSDWKEWKKQNCIKGNPPLTEDAYWELEYKKIDGLKKKDKNLSEPNCFYDELDITVRHRAFQLALHYWEGRWLQKIESDLLSQNFDGKGVDSVKNRWLRQAMITPCFVSTFYMAPKFFSSFRFLKKGEDGKNIFDNLPLFNFVDLLIVDEAGQVSPEVGVATFSLAKQAVVVGDVKQIEPVWNITSKIDIGNLKKIGLIKDYDDFVYENVYNTKGFLASSGSIMMMAQNACNFKETASLEKGVILVEHRRCYDEIINYCNTLAYNGQLKPLKGKSDKSSLFPPMLSIHVEGESIKTKTSRYNVNEVKAIVTWLKSNKEKIEKKYDKLENVVGIITPFVGQKQILYDTLKSEGFDTTIIKIGTVHALQGAERPVILFSTVYGRNDSETMFFDRNNKPNMLNVAVSRAKDNFIVFGNNKIFNKNSRSPSGILANHLVYQ